MPPSPHPQPLKGSIHQLSTMNHQPHISLPQIVVIDCDGVLTDGKLTINSTGTKLLKQFHTRDVRAIRELVSTGHEVYIVTADDWEGTKHFADKVGAQYVYMRDKSKVPEMLGNRPYICVGDDAWDIPMITAAKVSYCPANADTLVKTFCHGVLDTKGGEGVIAELLHVLNDMAKGVNPISYV